MIISQQVIVMITAMVMDSDADGDGDETDNIVSGSSTYIALLKKSLVY